MPCFQRGFHRIAIRVRQLDEVGQRVPGNGKLSGQSHQCIDPFSIDPQGAGSRFGPGQGWLRPGSHGRGVRIGGILTQDTRQGALY